jgi:cytochrome c oxidase subunit II
MTMRGFLSRNQLARRAPAAAALLTGCHADHAQSMLHPAGPASEHVSWVWWLLFTICTAVFVIVLVLTAIAVLWRPKERRRHSPLGNGFIVLSGVVAPAIILFIILLVAMKSQVALSTPETELTVRITGHRWWWEVEYPEQQIVTANEIHIPAGEPVRLELVSADVIHSFWVPNLNGKTDLLPEKTNVSWIAAHRPGVYRGQCAEYCGLQHALMGLVVVAVSREEFDAWVAARQAPSPEPATDQLRRGREVFFQAACNNCHALRDAPARQQGERGPDLTHIGARRTLAAGTLENNRGNLSGWIANPQAIKPGNLMPPSYLESEDLHALVAYLMSLQ